MSLGLAAGCSAKSVGGSSPTSASTTSAPVVTTSAPTTSVPPTTSAVPATPSTTAPVGPASLGGTCDDVLNVGKVNTAVGQPIIGTTNFIVGAAQTSIGRLTYLFCQYGFGQKVKGKPAPTPKVEITVSLYDTNEHAASRVSGTVDYYQSNGATATPATIGTAAGTLLLGYGAPTIVVADGPRTVAVSITATLTPTAQPQTLISLASMALTSTAQYTGTTAVATPAVSPTPAATS